MAAYKRSGSRRTTQRPPEAPASEAIPRVSKYTSIFEAITNLNRAFDQVLQGVERLKRMGFFRGEISNRIPRSCRLMLEELRGWAVSDMTIEITDTANDDWNRYGIQRYRFEQNTRDPEDVRRELERVKKRLDERAAKEKQANRPAGSKR
jgi:molybdenum cofactor biosynthesis enzyme MoaA